MKQTITYSVMPHVHWDREWYFTSSKSLVYSLHDFDEVIEELQQNESIACFLLDAQTSILEDYLVYHPEKEAAVKTLVANQRLLIGPWYTQADQLVIGGESILRNLMYGIEYAKKFGNCFMVGYAVDCFGQSAQMPQIYQGFGITKTIFKRGINLHSIPSSEFYWTGAGNSRVFAYHAIDYMNMRNIAKNNDQGALDQFFQTTAKAYLPRSLTKQIILFNGFDQYPIRRDIASIVEEAKNLAETSEHPFEIKIQSISEAMDEMQQQPLDFPSYEGELTCGQTGRLHKSIFSSRADIKILNNTLENYLVHVIEPLSAMEYHCTNIHESLYIKKMWKLMMENSAHDSIGTCNSDEVNRAIMQKYYQVKEMAEGLEEIVLRRMANAIEESSEYQFQLYNCLPYQRQEMVVMTLYSPYPSFCIEDSQRQSYACDILEVKEVTDSVTKVLTNNLGIHGRYQYNLLANKDNVYEVKFSVNVTLPAMGYETFVLVEQNQMITPSKSNIHELCNEYYHIAIAENGSLNILDKTTNLHYESMMVFEDSGDEGDSYDYSTPSKDWTIDSRASTIHDFEIEEHQHYSTATYRVNLKLPMNLSLRELQQADLNHEIKIKILLENNSKLIKVEIELENKAMEHRLRVIFPTKIPSQYSHADQQFGVIARPTLLPEVAIWQAEKWHEKPRTIEPMQSFVSLNNQTTGVSVMTDCVREYQIVGEALDTIALTLYRSYPFMGKPDLQDRPGRASGKPWATPDAELLKSMKFNFAICLGENNMANVATIAREYLTPIRCHQALFLAASSDHFIINEPKNRTLKPRLSLFSLEGNNTVFSILKKQEYGNGLVARVFGIGQGQFAFMNTEEFTVQSCKLDETILRTEQQDCPNGYAIGNNEIKTFVLGGTTNENN